MQYGFDRLFSLLDILNKENNTSISKEEFQTTFFSLIKEADILVEKNDLETIILELKKLYSVDEMGICKHVYQYINEKKITNTLTTIRESLKGFSFKNSKKCCLAPYTTLNFDTLGQIRVCCYNNQFILGKYPQNDLLEIWQGKPKKEFIDKLTNSKFPLGCKKCMVQAASNNTASALFTKFDKYEKYHDIDEAYPVALEFEFGTICNYECIMCGGKWSSSIRKNREKLPALKTPYDNNFLDKIIPFLKKAKVLNFLGGEPFLTPLYYKIWDWLLENNSLAEICITTNGSILNDRIKKYLNSPLYFKIILSIDSFNKDTYEYIRKNAKFETVMNNLEVFLSTKKLLSIAFCPMIQNIYELPQVAQFCIKQNIGVYINEVTQPLGGKIKGIHINENYNTKVWTGSDNNIEKINIQLSDPIPEFCLYTLTTEKLSDIIYYLKSSEHLLSDNKQIQQQYNNFINSLENYKNIELKHLLKTSIG